MSAPDVVLLVGEDNPHSLDADYALFDHPVGCSGHRLRTRILGLSRRTYLGPLVKRVNLCTHSSWSRWEARQAASDILSGQATLFGRLDARPAVVVALGRKVATAFDLSVEFFDVQVVEGVSVVSLPHPSGLSRAWNDPAAAPRARELLALVAPHVPWGEELP